MSSISMLVAFNKELIEEKDAVINVNDKAYFFDFVVYSSLKVIKGKIFFSEYHVDRLLESAKVLELNHQFSKEDVLEMLNKVVEKNSLNEAFLRIILIGDANENKNAKLYIFPLTGVHYYPDRFYKKGVKVITYHGERKFPTSKTKDLLLGFIASKEAERNQAIEALLIDKDGNIREGTKSNFFAIKGNTLITSPKEKVLEGITKKIILEICKPHFEIKEEDIPLSKIKEYDELFITSTLYNILPVIQVDDITLSSNFEKTKIIQRLFKEYYDKNVLNAN